MKRILLSLALLNLGGHISYGMHTQEQLHEPSQWTRSEVERALKAFEIPTESIKIYGFNKAGARTGFANSKDKTIAINEYGGNNLEQIMTSFHEAAHIKDNASAKIPLYAQCLTAVFLGGYVSMLPKLISFAEKRVNPRFTNHISAAIGSGCGALGAILAVLFYDNIALQWATEQAEYRADKMAVEKLIELNEIEPVVYNLMWKKLLEKEYGNQRIGGHPPARSEYKALKRILEKNRYEVRKYRPEDAPNDLKIKISKNGEGPFAQCQNFYSKV